uniref:Uncharacterized protein n=1 Tax=Dictyoglomus turgidum TaxID=513050 RepID=A0A7C3SN95_9BACT
MRKLLSLNDVGIEKDAWSFLARAATRIGPKMLEKAPGLTRGLQRTIYSLVGKAPGMQQKGLEGLKEIGFKWEQESPGIIDRLTKLIKGEEKWTKGRKAREEAAKAVLEKGYASIPGTIKGLFTNPKEMLSLKWKSMSPGEKALMAGFGALDIHEIKKAKEKGEPIGGAIANAALFPLTMGMSAIPQMAMWTAGGMLGERAGRGVEKLIRRERGLPPVPEVDLSKEIE